MGRAYLVRVPCWSLVGFLSVSCHKGQDLPHPPKFPRGEAEPSQFFYFPTFESSTKPPEGLSPSALLEGKKRDFRSRGVWLCVYFLHSPDFQFAVCSLSIAFFIVLLFFSSQYCTRGRRLASFVRFDCPVGVRGAIVTQAL